MRRGCAPVVSRCQKFLDMRKVCGGTNWPSGFEMSLPQCLGYALGMRQAHLRHQPISEFTSPQTEFLFPPVGVDIHISCKERAYSRRMVFWSTSTWEHPPKACTNAYWTRDFGICARYAPAHTGPMASRRGCRKVWDMRWVCATHPWGNNRTLDSYPPRADSYSSGGCFFPHRSSRLQSSSGKGSWIHLGTIFLSQE